MHLLFSNTLQVLRVSAQYELVDEAQGQLFSANGSTRQLVRPGKGATLGHLVDHLVRALSPAR